MKSLFFTLLLAELKKIAEAAGRNFWVFWLPVNSEE
jgi:hypothetical protein